MTESPGYPIPDREDERIASLVASGLLDTAPDVRFDALVDLASSHFEAPVSLVSLIDRDRQWFKASIGFDLKQTPREQSFCAHAILNPDQVFIVEDATLDPRFKHNPLVTGTNGIRFYAGAPILGDDGHALGTICVIDSRPRTINEKDRRFLSKLSISASAFLELHRKTLAFRDLAERDPLTGLPNRRALEADLGRAVAVAREGRPCGVLFIDVDHFKAINDAHGHEFGDLFLRAFALRLQASVRKRDKVARLGGDEFVILLSNELDEPGLGVVSRRILDACAAPLTIQGVQVASQVSIGGALAPRHAIEAKALLKAADEALYDAKRSGRGRLVVAKPGRSVAAKSAGLEDDLRMAIARDELRLVWQPCLDLAGGGVCGYEALARWTHPQFGPISPEVFVPLAENGGMSGDFDAWVLRRACREALEGPPGGTIAVNMSAYTLCEADFPSMLLAVLEETGLPPERIVLEITERTLITDPKSALEAMTKLNAIGVSFALDDFGAGYAAFSYLAKYPFRVLKMDRSLIVELEPQSRALTIVAGIVEVARRLGMTVVAEGVETEIQATLLREAGCEIAQGYLFARPGPLPIRAAASALTPARDA